MRKSSFCSLLTALLFCFSEVKSQDFIAVDSLKINQIQTLGSQIDSNKKGWEYHYYSQYFPMHHPTCIFQ